MEGRKGNAGLGLCWGHGDLAGPVTVDLERLRLQTRHACSMLCACFEPWAQLPALSSPWALQSKAIRQPRGCGHRASSGQMLLPGEEARAMHGASPTHLHKLSINVSIYKIS
jgi:hypothetical protein